MEPVICKVRKVAQIAAYLLHKGGGSMEHVKLMQLMYLADREAINTYGFQLSEDTIYAMRMGPVLSLTIRLMNGEADSAIQCEWDDWISAKERHHVGTQKPIKESDLDELSDQELSLLKKVFDKFGDWPKGNLIQYTHDLDEWTDPGDGSRRIWFRDIFAALGKPESEIEAKLGYLEHEAYINASPFGPSNLLLPPPPYPKAHAGELDAILGA